MAFGARHLVTWRRVARQVAVDVRCNQRAVTPGTARNTMVALWISCLRIAKALLLSRRTPCMSPACAKGLTSRSSASNPAHAAFSAESRR
jgi:hypothetical protein